MAFAMVAALLAAGCGKAEETSKAGATSEARNAASTAVYATRRALMSWVDEKASKEDTDKALQAAAGALERAKAEGASDPKVAAALAKARDLLEIAAGAVKAGNKAGAIDAAASLTEVAYQIGDPAPTQ